MTVVLEFVGKSIARQNMTAFLDGLREQYSMLGEAGLHKVAEFELSRSAPRNKNFVQHLIGRDILGVDVDPDRVVSRDDFVDARIVDGELVERFLADEYQAAVDRYFTHILPTTIEAWPLMTRTEKGRIINTPVNERERLVDPAGLSKTYVWRASTDWLAEVEDADVEIIRNSGAAGWFRNVERHGRFRNQRAWDLPVIERHAFDDAREAKAYEDDLKRKSSWFIT